MLGKSSAYAKKDAISKLDAVMGLLAHIVRRIESSNLCLAEVIKEYPSEILSKYGFFSAFDGVRMSAVKAWGSGISQLQLPKEAEDILCGLCDGLGLLCREKQLNELKNANDALAAIKSRMEAEYGKKEKYYGALGALFGALAVVVLI